MLTDMAADASAIAPEMAVFRLAELEAASAEAVKPLRPIIAGRRPGGDRFGVFVG